MSQARFAWAAFKNMMRAAARDPLWAFLSLLAAPFRIWQTLLRVLFILIVALFVVGPVDLVPREAVSRCGRAGRAGRGRPIADHAQPAASCS